MNSTNKKSSGWVVAIVCMVCTVGVGLLLHGTDTVTKVPIINRKGNAETRVVRLIPAGFSSWNGGMWALRIHAEVHNPTFEPLYIRQVVCVIISDHQWPI